MAHGQEADNGGLIMQRLLDLIAKAESNGDYNIVYGGKRVPLTSMTIDEVRAWQDGYVSGQKLVNPLRFASSAVGRYQIIRKTLDSLVAEMKVSSADKFDEAMQDRMALHLLRRRGLNAYLAGSLSPTNFADRLAKEWASLPVMATGRSYYDSDGVNKAHVKPEQMVEALRIHPDPATRITQGWQDNPVT